MSRFVLAALALATLALPGARASAEDCMCVGPDGGIQLASAIVAERTALAALTPADPTELESPDDTIETVDPSLDLKVLDTLKLAEPSPLRRGPIAWCRSADDPRCRRDDSGETPHRITLGTAPFATLVSTPRIPMPAISLVRFGREVTRGPAGIHVRLERPPRA